MKLLANLLKTLNKYIDDPFIVNSNDYSINTVFRHPYVKNFRAALKQLVKDRNSVWKYQKDGSEQDLYILLFVDSTKKVFYDKASVIFPSTSPKSKIRNNTNVSRGGLRFFKNPELQQERNRFKKLAGIKN